MSYKTRARKRAARKAQKQATGLTPKQQRREDRLANRVERPLLGPGQAYVTPGGYCFHTEWCVSVNGYWMSGADKLQIILRENVGTRYLCLHCRGDA